MFNVLHFPAGSVPITEVLPGEDKDFQDNYGDVITKRCRSSVMGSAGMPINIQVATPRWKDEECLAIMKVLEESVHFIKRPNFDVIEASKEVELNDEKPMSLIKLIFMLFMALFYILIGINHFVNPDFFDKMMPPFLPYKHELHLFAGAAEIAGGLGLLIPYTRKAAAWGIIALLFSVFMANIHLAFFDVPVFGNEKGYGWKGWIRLPF